MAEREQGEAARLRGDVTESRDASRAPVRRDPRADPDDDEVPTSTRVDVIVSRPDAGVDNLTNAALTLRRELAKLHQQAAAVERTIEDQRRERSDALERSELATTKADELQRQLEMMETELTTARGKHDESLAELQGVRSERDDLARAIESAKSTTEDIVRLRAEVTKLEQSRDEARRTSSTYEAELAEIRKREQVGARRVSDTETELATLREKLERAAAELTQTRDEGTRTKAELVRVRQELAGATEATAQIRDDAERERVSAREHAERIEKRLEEARVVETKLAAAETELAATRREAGEARAEISRIERDLEAARHARDVSIERTTMAEKEREDETKERDRQQRELETAHATTARAEARAAASERARVFVEDGVRQLRDEVTTAFARWRSIAPSVAPGSVPPPTRAIPPSSSMRSALASTSPEPPVEEGWSSPPPAPDSSAPTVASIPIPPLPAISGSVPPPPLPTRSRPPPIPPPRRPSIPSPVFSTPPPAGSLPDPPAQELQLDLDDVQEVMEATPAPGGSVAPGPVEREESPGLGDVSKGREELLERLANPETSREAAVELREHPEWLRGRPPVTLLAALTCLDYDVEAPMFELARGWEREAMCRAVIGALRDEPDPKLREHGAWLLKHLGSPSALPALSDLVTSEDELPGVRRWLLEAIERLVASRAVSWKDVGDLVTALVRHPDPSLRDGVIGVIAALERVDDKRRLLLQILRTDDDEVVLSSAVHALSSVLPIELDPAVAERLLGHPSLRVQRSVLDFIERSKRAGRA